MIQGAGIFLDTVIEARHDSQTSDAHGHAFDQLRRTRSECGLLSAVLKIEQCPKGTAARRDNQWQLRH